MADAAADARDVELLVGGLSYAGWKAVRASVGIDRCAGDFSLEVVEPVGAEDVTRKIRPGDECALVVAGEVVISGYVDAVELAVDANDHRVTISGRDKAGDVMDCSAVHKPGQWRGQKVEAIAKQLLQPFGIEVKADVDTGAALASFALQEGETVYEALERAARLRGLLLVSDGVGGLVFTRAGLQRADDQVIYGLNMLQGQASFDVKDRFSSYVVKGQCACSDDWNSEAALQVKGTARDVQMRRYRPMVVTGEAQDAAGTLMQRAQWEADVRRAKSMQFELVVQGLRQANGKVWRHNRLVRVLAEPLRLDGDLLIAAVTYLVSDRGTFTELHALPADAFAMLDTGSKAAGRAKASAEAEYFDTPRDRR